MSFEKLIDCTKNIIFIFSNYIHNGKKRLKAQRKNKQKIAFNMITWYNEHLNVSINDPSPLSLGVQHHIWGNVVYISLPRCTECLLLVSLYHASMLLLLFGKIHAYQESVDFCSQKR